MDDRPNLILSPHFDDAVLSLGGLIAKAPERASIVTVFAAAPAGVITTRWDRRSGFANAAEAMRVRSIENDSALAALGVSKPAIRNLGHFDHQYRRRQCAGTAAGLCSAIADDIRRLLPDQQHRVNLFTPASAWHPDHRVVTDAVLELVRRGECRDAAIFLYQDQPYAYLELRRKTLLLLKFADFAVLDRTARQRAAQPLQRRLIDLSAADVARKTEAIRLYKSQFRFIRGGLQKMIADFAYYQAARAGSAQRYCEVVYRLLTA